jgi:hypothetical protein
MSGVLNLAPIKGLHKKGKHFVRSMYGCSTALPVVNPRPLLPRLLRLQLVTFARTKSAGLCLVAGGP